MDIRSLIQFLQIAKDGSYTKAAENLFLVQSTLSKTVQSLEAETGGCARNHGYASGEIEKINHFL